MRQVIAACEQVTGRRLPIVQMPPRPGDPPRLIAAADKARRELGWVPQYPKLEEIVASAWAWHRTHPQGYPA